MEALVQRFPGARLGVNAVTALVIWGLLTWVNQFIEPLMSYYLATAAMYATAMFGMTILLGLSGQVSLGNGALIPAAPAATKLKPPRASQPSTVGALASDPLLAAIGRAHGKSAAQVALRYILQKNVTVATQSTSQAAVRLSGEAV